MSRPIRFHRLKERLVYENSRIQLFDDEVEGPDGSNGTYIRFCYRGNPPGVVIVPRLPDGRLLLLRIHRYAVDEDSIEFPRGGSNPGESIEDAGRRELNEETGLSAIGWRLLGYHRPDAAIVMTEAGVLLADLDDRAEREAMPTQSEGIADVILADTAEVWTWLRSGMIRDGFTLGALALLHADEIAERTNIARPAE